MKRFRYSVIAIFLAVQFIFPGWVLSAPIGHFLTVSGDVKVTRAGKSIAAQVKMPLEVADVIETGPGAEAKLLLQDESTITLAQKTHFKIDEFLVKEKSRTGSFFVTIGRIVVDVKKFIGGESSFLVRSPTAVAGVRGTGFEFIVAQVGSQVVTTVTCTAGSLTLSALSATGAIISTTVITAGQTAVITATGITVSAAAAGAGAAGAAGATAGTATAAGITTGTVATAAVVAAGVITTVIISTTSSEAVTTHHH